MAEYRVGVIAIYSSKEQRQLVLITSRSSGDWILPTGKHESVYSDRRVARDEAYEEAGVRGRRLRKLRSRLRVERYRGGCAYTLKLYRLDVIKLLNDWPERKQRKRRLIDADDLETYISDAELRSLIRQQLHAG